MIRFALVASVMASACTVVEPGERAGSGECPAGEECSDVTPEGLHFSGARFADQLISEPAATAIGGTQEILITQSRNDELEPLRAPYRADDDGAAGVRVLEQLGATVKVGGTGSRSNYLRIVEPDSDLLYDRYELAGAAVSEIAILSDGTESLPADAEYVWGPGRQRVVVGLYGDVQRGNSPERQRIVDTSMSIALASSEAESWDLRSFTASVGTHSLSVTAGDVAPRTLSVTVVPGADTISRIDTSELTVEAGDSAVICFQATNSGRYVLGLTWRFEANETVTSNGYDSWLRNCTTVSGDGSPGQTLPLVVSAGGVSKTFGVAIVPSTAKRAAQAIENIQTAGRATLVVPAAGERAQLAE